MPSFNQQSFNEFVVEHNVYGFFEEAITLKSGRRSHFYANWRNVVEDAFLTERLVEYLLAFVEDHGLEVDTFYGVPEGATKLGVIAQYTWAKRQTDYGQGSHVLAMGRARPKDHGAPKDRYFVGTPRGRVVVLEDTTTTAGSAIKTLDALKDLGIQVVAMISLTNRMETRDDGASVKEAVEQRGIRFYNMCTAIEILPLVYRKTRPGEAIGKAVEAEYREFGVEEIKLV